MKIRDKVRDIKLDCIGTIDALLYVVDGRPVYAVLWEEPKKVRDAVYRTCGGNVKDYATGFTLNAVPEAQLEEVDD